MSGVAPTDHVGAAPLFLIELLGGMADGARMGILVEPPETWDVGEVPLAAIHNAVPGQVVTVPVGKIRVHRYRRTDEMTADGKALVYRYLRTFP